METYSRYIPNGSGGFQRTTVTVPPVQETPAPPEEAVPFASQGRTAPAQPVPERGPAPEPQKRPGMGPSMGAVPHPGAAPHTGTVTHPGTVPSYNPPPRRGPTPHPGAMPPGPSGLLPPIAAQGPLSLRRLLPGDTDIEDLLILLILVLLLLEEGESGTVILCAVLAYFILGRLEQPGGPSLLPGIL